MILKARRISSPPTVSIASSTQLRATKKASWKLIGARPEDEASEEENEGSEAGTEGSAAMYERSEATGEGRE